MSASLSTQPPMSLGNISSCYGTTVSFGTQPSGSASYVTASHNLSPLPIRANQISTMPPLCQVPTINVIYNNNRVQIYRQFFFSLSITLFLCVYFHSHKHLLLLTDFSKKKTIEKRIQSPNNFLISNISSYQLVHIEFMFIISYDYSILTATTAI